MGTTNVLDRVSWPTSIRERRPSAEDRIRFREHGFVELANLWTPPMSDALAQESARLHAEAVEPVGGASHPVSACRHTGAARVATGSVIRELHESLTAYVQALAEQPLVATAAAYRYFHADDGVLLHADADAAEIVLMATVLGEVGPLSVRPELRGRTPAELEAIGQDPTWNRNGGHLLHPPALGVIALRGSEVPHHRTPRPIPTLSAVAALHYRSPY